MVIEEERAQGFEYAVKNKTLVLCFQGDIDHHNAVQIRKEADRLIERKQIRNLLFDFSGVRFMDSSGIGMIMGRYKQVIFSGGKIAATGVGQEVDRILLISGLYRIMQKYECMEDALEKLECRDERKPLRQGGK